MRCSAGLRERSHVQIVIPAVGDEVQIAPVVGRVVGLPAAPDSVTGQMSVAVIDGLEMVHIQHQQSQRLVVAPGQFDLAFRCRGKTEPVAQPGEAVNHREFVHRAPCLLQRNYGGEKDFIRSKKQAVLFK